MSIRIEWSDTANVDYIDDAGDVEDGNGTVNDGPCIAGPGFCIEPAGYPATTPDEGRQRLVDMLDKLRAQIVNCMGRDPKPAHDDPTIAAFLSDGGYASIEAWMLDSDYHQVGNRWYSYGVPVDPEAQVMAAIEASGFQVQA